jgi:hypothetical protein
VTLTAGEWFALGFGLGVITTWVWLLVAAVFPRMWSRWQHRDRDK